MAGQIESQRKRITPGFEQQRKAEAAALQRAAALEEAARKRKEAAEAAREANSHVVCSDGWVSSCLCSRASKRGCCSHHGGIAGCE